MDSSFSSVKSLSSVRLSERTDGTLYPQRIQSEHCIITNVLWNVENPFYSQHRDRFRSPEFANQIKFCLLLERLKKGKLALSLHRIDNDDDEAKTEIRNESFWTDIEVSFSILRRSVNSSEENELYKKTTFMCRSVTSITVQFDAHNFKDSGDYVALKCELKWPNDDGSVVSAKTIDDEESAGASKDELENKQRITADEGEMRDHFGSLFESEKFSDLTVVVQEQNFNVHRFVVAARSPVFAAMLDHETLENDEGVILVEDFNPEVIAELIRFMYTCQTKELDLPTVLSLYEAADKYQLLGLKLKCSQVLSVKMTPDIALDVLVKAVSHDDEHLKEAAVERILDSEGIMETEGWLDFLKNHPASANCVIRRCMDEARSYGRSAKRLKTT